MTTRSHQDTSCSCRAGDSARAARTVLALVLATLPPGMMVAAHAQGVGGSFEPPSESAPVGVPVNPGGTGAVQPPEEQPSSGDTDAKAPPPTLPGSHAVPTTVIPSTRSTSDMNPTAALFDAIARGDTVAARDALSRGADPSARNVLGQTPIDVSVDLGRNDISFLLLSLRTEAATNAATQPTPRAAPRAALSVPPRAARAAAAPAPAGGQVGTPAPSQGFLGFGGS